MKKQLFNKNEILWMIFFSVVVTLVFMAYFVLIGIPKTQSRNYYNKGMDSYESGELIDAEKSFEEAKKFWDESYIPQL